MRNTILTVLVFSALLVFNACEKCYRCHNVCKVCYEQHTDTTLTITVCSDVFGEEFYKEYLDSLTSPALGWVCADTANTKNMRFCGTKSGNNSQLLNKKAQGYICSPE
ncbi:MAG: hypothetical protein KIS94_13495 [Chitinophagales bacterium]|nr:hypothetical protein [Chitinophagales bacterium]